MNKFSVFYQIPVICDEVEELINFLVKNNIDIARQHIKNLANYKIYNKYYSSKILIAEKLHRKILLLPCYPELSLNNINKITDLIQIFYTSRNND